jgi:hypothetical protein
MNGWSKHCGCTLYVQRHVMAANEPYRHSKLGVRRWSGDVHGSLDSGVRGRRGRHRHMNHLNLLSNSKKSEAFECERTPVTVTKGIADTQTCRSTQKPNATS